MGKKGLAIIYDPHNLYQFVWYFCNKGKNKEWDALCLPNGYKGEYMHTYCEDAGIFSNIYKSDMDFSALSTGKKFKTIIEMFFFFITGNRSTYCRKLINQYVNYEAYDEIVVIADVGVVSGACVALGQEKKVVILEDGISDYSDRPRFVPKEKLCSLYSWQGFFLALMGYCSPGWFKLKTDNYCIKYCSQPEKMIYKGYREIRQLYEEDGTDQQLFDQVIKRIYPGINEIDFSNIDAILMTRPLSDYVVDYKKYKERLEGYISCKYKNIILKRHPREKEDYNFKSSVNVNEIDNSIPAEVLLPYLTGKDIVIVSTSAIMLYMKAYGLNCTVLDLDGLYEESKTSNSMFNPLSKVGECEFCEKFAENHYTIRTI